MNQTIKKHKLSIIWILYIFTVMHIFFGNATFPFFNNVDEHAHFDLIVKYSRWHLPTKQSVHFDSESTDLIVKYGSPEYFYRPEYYVTKKIPLPVWKLNHEEQKVEMDKQTKDWIEKKNHENFSPPIYYTVMGVWYNFGKLISLTGGHLLYWLRFLNILVYGILFWVTYHFVQRIFSENINVQLSILTLFAFFPQDVFYSINSDILSPLFCFLALAFLIEIYYSDKSSFIHFLTGILISIAFLIKIANIPLLAIFGILVLQRLKKIYANGKNTKQFFNIFILVISFFIPIISWFVWNLQTLGDITGTAEKVRDLGWTLKPIVDILNHPIFTFKGFGYFFSELIPSFWRGEFFWGMRRLASKNSDIFYVLSSSIFLIISMFNTFLNKSSYSEKQRLVNIISIFYVWSSILFLIILSMIYDFSKGFYPSEALPYFTSGRLMIGMLIPFLILYVDGLQILLQRISKRINLLIIVVIISIFISQFEIGSLIMVAKSNYNWFHL